MTIPQWMGQKSNLLIDSNLLIVIVIGRARESLLGRKPIEAFHLSDFEHIAEFASLFKTIPTTPFILSEVNCLINKTGFARSECRAAFASQVDLMQESYHQSQTLIGDVSFVDFGITDISIKAAATNDTLVLTDDEALLGLLTQAGIAALRYQDLIDTE